MPVRRVTKNETEKENPKDRIVDGFYKVGFRKIPAPGVKMPVFPSNLQTLSILELSEQQAIYGAWREFSEDIVRTLNVHLAFAQKDYDSIYAQKMVMVKTEKGLTVTDKKYMVDIDPDVKEKYLELMHYEVERDMYAAKVDTFTNCLAILSREVSLRQK